MGTERFRASAAHESKTCCIPLVIEHIARDPWIALRSRMMGFHVYTNQLQYPFHPHSLCHPITLHALDNCKGKIWWSILNR